MFILNQINEYIHNDDQAQEPLDQSHVEIVHDISSKELAKRVQNELTGSQYIHARKAIEAVLDNVKHIGSPAKET